MKIILPMLLLFFAVAGFADDITTTDGKTYKGVEITKTEPDGITIMSDSGVEKIPFTSLPKDLQTKYGYDPDKAAAYAAQDAVTQSQIFQANEKALKQKVAADNALAAGKPDDDDAKGPKYRIMLVVQEKTDDGVLLWIGPPGEFHDPKPEMADAINKVRAFKRISAARIFLKRHPNEDKLKAGDDVICVAVQAGTATVDGVSYPAYKWVPVDE